MIIMRINLS